MEPEPEPAVRPPESTCPECDTAPVKLKLQGPLLPVLSSYGVGAELLSVVQSILASVCDISLYLRETRVISRTSTHNIHGDEQLSVDVAADQAVLRHLAANPHAATAASEEHDASMVLRAPTDPALKSPHYSVAFDPLDGSSIIDANFAVGSIFGIYAGSCLVGPSVTGRCQVSSLIAQYGPRTTVLLALPKKSTNRNHDSVLEAQLDQHGQWWYVRGPIRISDGKTFAPGNLRAATDDPRYSQLVNYWIHNKYTLRYTGGMVPDVYHIFTKQQGIFVTPVTKQSPAKLRLLYECAPIALLMECAGGASCDETGSRSTLDLVIPNTNVRCGIAVGSTREVHRFAHYMTGAGAAATATSSSTQPPLLSKSKL